MFKKNKFPFGRIFLTEASKKLKIRRFVEDSSEASKKLKIRRFVEDSSEASKKLKIRRFVEDSSDIPEEWRIKKCEQSKHFRYIKLYLIYY